jgi:putative peptidoglycan lipid II flippase
VSDNRLDLDSRPGFRQGLPQTLVRTGLVSLAGKGAGFLVPIFAAAWFGAGSDTDAFFLAYAVVLFGVGVWGTGLETVAISQVARWLSEHRVNVDQELAWARRWVLGSAAVGMVLLAAVHLFIILPTVSAHVSWRTSVLSLALLFPMFFAAASNSLLTGGLAAAGHFSLASGSQALRGIGALVGAVLVRGPLGVLSLALGYTMGEWARWVLLSTYWRRLRRQAALPLNAVDPDVVRGLRRAALVAAGPQMAAFALVGIAPLAERWVSGGIGAGAVSYLDYGSRLYAVPSSLFDASVAGVLQSYWAGHYYRGAPQAVARSVRRVVLLALLIATAVAGVAWFERQFLVSLALHRGAFTLADAQVVAVVFGVLMLGFPTGMAALVLERAYMAAQSTHVLLGIAVVKLVVRVSAAIIGGALFGLPGVALAQPVTTLADLALLGLFWRRGHLTRAPAP